MPPEEPNRPSAGGPRSANPDAIGDEYPHYDALQELLKNSQALSLGSALGREDDTDEPADPDPDGKILDAISEGRTVGPQSVHEHVGTLAGLGYSIGTVADALGIDEQTVETFAAERIEELKPMFGFDDDPD